MSARKAVGWLLMAVMTALIGLVIYLILQTDWISDAI